MAGFLRGTGKVRIDGLEVNRANLRKIRASLGSCLENPEDQLFMPRLFDDVAFGPINMGLEPAPPFSRSEAGRGDSHDTIYGT